MPYPKYNRDEVLAEASLYKDQIGKSRELAMHRVVRYEEKARRDKEISPGAFICIEDAFDNNDKECRLKQKHSTCNLWMDL